MTNDHGHSFLEAYFQEVVQRYCSSSSAQETEVVVTVSDGQSLLSYQLLPRSIPW